ncbi:hypothetical protein G7Z17_g8615 [Cylindrodendrum hubeiense]|uniref:Yeast cell wall synthesis Kre9/Knh1-like N-terminal domain-containing protein n=1 Tax=Cylindrodendrum hubeiense TaxID=595255 RepID=A0A9P5LEJ3_9HYPO|nr:hypothetical protein G7Z17_g8615 [Cylindrodendrum hubeiense]
MQFRFSAAAALAFIASAIAQTTGFDSVFTPTSGEVVTAGSDFTLEWTAPGDWADAKYTVTIGLIGGATQNGQAPLLTVATGVKNNAGSYTWSVPATLGGLNFYGFTFTLEQDTSVFQYSNPFNIEAGAAEETTEAVTEAAATSTAGVDYAPPPPVATLSPPAAPTTIIDTPSNGTWTTAVVPVGSTTGSYPVATTPAATTVVTGAGARVGASMAVVGGLVLAALAL